MFDLGDEWLLQVQTENPPGLLAEPDTITLTITKPDGTTVTPTPVPVENSVGRYSYPYVPTVAGRHHARWVWTYTGGDDGALTEVVNVTPADSGGIISLAAAKAYLKVPNDSDDEELRDWIAATTELVEKTVGPCVIRQFTSVIASNDSSWWLPNFPKRDPSGVLTLVSVAAFGHTGALVDEELLDVDPSTGEVLHADGRCFPRGRYKVTYRAGRTILPGTITTAAKMILKHLWTNQRGAAAGRRGHSMEETVQPAGFPWAVPKAAMDMLTVHDDVVTCA